MRQHNVILSVTIVIGILLFGSAIALASPVSRWSDMDSRDDYFRPSVTRLPTNYTSLAVGDPVDFDASMVAGA